MPACCRYACPLLAYVPPARPPARSRRAAVIIAQHGVEQQLLAVADALRRQYARACTQLQEAAAARDAFFLHACTLLG